MNLDDYVVVKCDSRKTHLNPGREKRLIWSPYSNYPFKNKH